MDWTTHVHPDKWDLNPFVYYISIGEHHNLCEWKRTWKFRADMKGLRDLRVILRFAQWSADYQAVKNSFLDPVREITGVENFKLQVPRQIALSGLGLEQGNMQRPNWMDLPSCKVEPY